jgi:hypothetical protein
MPEHVTLVLYALKHKIWRAEVQSVRRFDPILMQAFFFLGYRIGGSGMDLRSKASVR